ncbi:MAG: TrkH family potassium uptake protein [Bacteroidales bacterium]|nr:TrkH family potassium uptake protein [Bacteroidales bacterium]
MLLSLPFSWYYGSAGLFNWGLFDVNYDFWPLVISSLICFLTGTILYFVNGKAMRESIGKREGYIIVSSAWVVISVFGALPFILNGSIPDFTDAFFETMSGFTTTGATILTDIEAVPKGLLFWRATTHWIGGMGIIVLSLAILPFLGIGGMQLFIAEVPGPTPDKLHPRITQTAKRLWGIYFLLTFAQTLLMMLGGLDLFDSLTHAFATMATGGFSTKNDSIASFSPYLQYVITVFMFLAGVNFTLHYMALHGRLRDVFRNEEFRYYVFAIVLSTVVIATVLVLTNFATPELSFREAVFTVVSIMTTTGFVTADYLMWPGALWFIIFMLMFIGGSAGSTGGGVKVVRQMLLLKNSLLELKRLLHPQAVIPVRMNGKPVSQEIILRVLAFFLIYMLVFAFGVFVMSMLGLDFDTAIGASIASLGNIGPGIGKVGPVFNFTIIPDLGKWFLSFLMLLGRLEFFTVLILFSPAFWRR